MQSGLYSSSPVSYSSGAMPSATAPHSGKPQAMQPLPITHQGQLRNKVNFSLHINKSLYILLKYIPPFPLVHNQKHILICNSSDTDAWWWWRRWFSKSPCGGGIVRPAGSPTTIPQQLSTAQSGGRAVVLGPGQVQVRQPAAGVQ